MFTIFTRVWKYFSGMATARSLLASFPSLSISSSCLRNIVPKGTQVAHFSTTPVARGGPISRLRRERSHAKLRRAKSRAEELRIQREARADPVIGHTTAFTESLLRPRQVLAQPGIAAHTRAGEEDWPLLTNFGVSNEDALTLSQAAKAAEQRRLEQGGIGLKWTQRQRLLYDSKKEALSKLMEQVDKDDAKKREAMARLIDLTNANSKAVIDANLEKAIIHFGRHEGDTGSPEVQAGVLTVKILALHEHMRHNRQDNRTKRALNMYVHQRQKMLKYLRRKSPERYAQCIGEIGLDDSAIVREVR